MKTPVKLFSCTQSTTLSKQIAKHFGQDLGSVYFQRYSDGEFQPSFEESVTDGSIIYINNVGLPEFDANSSDLLSSVLRSFLNQTISILVSLFFKGIINSTSGGNRTHTPRGTGF